MKYFTKQWYELCQKTSAHFQLEVAKEAEVFSEEYFQQLYNQKSAEWLALQEGVVSISFEDIFPAEMNDEFFYEGITDVEIAELKADYKLKREESKERFASRKLYDPEEETKHFQLRHLYRLEESKKMLPEQILSKIADLRVFCLDKASGEVIEAVTKFCEDNRNLVESTSKKYFKYYEEVLRPLDKDIINNIHFHDCIVKDIIQNEKCLTIVFDNKGGFTDIDQMQLENYRVIKQEGLLKEAWWLYEEVYITDGKYEIHALLQGKDAKLLELTVLAEQVSFKHSRKKFKF